MWPCICYCCLCPPPPALPLEQRCCRVGWLAGSWQGAGRELPGFSVLQLGTTPLLRLHHHHSFGAFLRLLAFCLPQHRVQDVGFHLQNSARAVPSTAVSYVAANRLLLCISKCQRRGPGSSGDALCAARQYIFSHFLLKALSSISSHNSDFHTRSCATKQPSHNTTPTAFRKLSLAQLCCLVPNLIKDTAHWNPRKYFPWLQRALEQAYDNPDREGPQQPLWSQGQQSRHPQWKAACTPRALSALLLLAVWFHTWFFWPACNHFWGADPAFPQEVQVFVHLRLVLWMGARHCAEQMACLGTGVFSLVKMCLCISRVIETIDPKWGNQVFLVDTVCECTVPITVASSLTYKYHKY